MTAIPCGNLSVSLFMSAANEPFVALIKPIRLANRLRVQTRAWRISWRPPRPRLPARNNFRFARNPSSIDAKRGDRFLTSRLKVLIAEFDSILQKRGAYGHLGPIAASAFGSSFEHREERTAPLYTLICTAKGNGIGPAFY